MPDENVQDYLAHEEIKWQLILAERLGREITDSRTSSGWSKRRFTIGNGMMGFKELYEVMLNVEIALNNRPLSCVEEDVDLPVLTPNSILFREQISHQK